MAGTIKLKKNLYLRKAAKLFCGVDFDMNQFADCTERGAQSATELYNQELVHGTRGAEIFAAFNFFIYIVF